MKVTACAAYLVGHVEDEHGVRTMDDAAWRESSIEAMKITLTAPRIVSFVARLPRPASRRLRQFRA